MDRYSRQIRFPGIGKSGQEKISNGSVVLIGCGALGTVIANLLTRAGVGYLKLVDRDVVELSNLQRQMLFDENDVESNLPKVVAAANRLKQINSEITIEPVVADVTPGNITTLVQNADIILDGTDNFETRFLINDVAVALQKPWIYGGCLGADGQTMTIIPKQSACLRCLMPDGPPPTGTSETCDSSGIIGPIINTIGAIQATEALKLLTGHLDTASHYLKVVSLWANQLNQIDLSSLREQSECPTCKHQQFEWLEGDRFSQSSILCGRDGVQLRFFESEEIDLKEIGQKLSSHGELFCNDYLLKLKLKEHELTLFADGRALVMGTDNPTAARKICAELLGT